MEEAAAAEELAQRADRVAAAAAAVAVGEEATPVMAVELMETTCRTTHMEAVAMEQRLSGEGRTAAAVAVARALVVSTGAAAEAFQAARMRAAAAAMQTSGSGAGVTEAKAAVVTEATVLRRAAHLRKAVAERHDTHAAEVAAAADPPGAPPGAAAAALMTHFHAAATLARREFHQLAAAALEAELEAAAGAPPSLEGLLAAQVTLQVEIQQATAHADGASGQAAEAAEAGRTAEAAAAAALGRRCSATAAEAAGLLTAVQAAVAHAAQSEEVVDTKCTLPSLSHSHLQEGTKTPPNPTPRWTVGGAGASAGARRRRSMDAREDMRAGFCSLLWPRADDSERSAAVAAQDDAVDLPLASSAGGLSMNVKEREEEGVLRDGVRRLRAEAAEARAQAQAVGEAAAALARSGRTADATAATELARQWTHRSVRLRAQLSEVCTESGCTETRRTQWSTQGGRARSSDRGSVAPVGAGSTAAAADRAVPGDAQALQRLREEVRATLLDVKRMHAGVARWTEVRLPQLADAATLLARRWAADAEHTVARVRAAELALGTSGCAAGAAASDAGTSGWSGARSLGR